jgi:polar amino acid transport system permease protein
MIRMSGRRSITWFAVTWIEIARNTPALLQLFFFGFGLGAFGIHLSPFFIVLCALSFNNAGYLSENFRGGFQAVPETQVKAARSLGMTYAQAYLRIVIPQVLRIVYHPMTNQMVWSVLMSSLGMLVGFRELSGETQFLASKTFRIFEYFLVTAGIYYVIVKLILGGSRLLGWRLFRY